VSVDFPINEHSINNNLFTKVSKDIKKTDRDLLKKGVVYTTTNIKEKVITNKELPKLDTSSKQQILKQPLSKPIVK